MKVEPTRDRIDQIDALRGFALFGILLANILYWSGWVLVTPAERAVMAGPEAQLWQFRFQHLLVDGKFYTLFSLLFGAGFALQLERLARRGADGLRIYRRRVLVLLAIGLFHSLLIWDGDILTLYAVMGLLLPLFHRWSERRLLAGAVTLIFVVPLMGSWLVEAPGRSLYALSDAVLAALGYRPGPDVAMKILPNADLRDVAAWNLSGTWFSWGLRLDSWRIPKVLGIMLLGILVGRRLAAETLLGDRKLLMQVLIAGLAVGVPFSLAYALLPGQHQDGWASQLGTVPLALAYAAAFMLAWPRLGHVLGQFVAPGRMALTNYLAHSIVGAILFYGIGFGLIGRLSPLQFYTVAVAIFASQVVLSRWWLSTHRQGPMEAIWRYLTYGATVRTGPRAA